MFYSPIEPKNAFVAFFDIIGFKELRKAEGTAQIHSLYNKGILPQIQHSAALQGKAIVQNGQSIYVPDPGPHSVEYRIVSDSILLFSNGDTFVDFFQMVTAAHSLTVYSLVNHKTPLRGAIGHGDLILDPQSIWLGTAIEDAYQSESGQVWAGCRFTSNCVHFLGENDYLNEYKRLIHAMYEVDIPNREKIIKAAKKIVRYKVPTQYNPKSGPVQYGEEDGLVLNWTTNIYPGASEKAFRVSENTHARKIQSNTVSFEKWARQIDTYEDDILKNFHF